jgi:hypothetical protein
MVCWRGVGDDARTPSTKHQATPASTGVAAGNRRRPPLQTQSISGHHHHHQPTTTRCSGARTKVAGEGLLAPRHVAGVADGRKRAQRLVGARVFQRDGQRAVAAHAVASDARVADVQGREVRGQQRGQLLRVCVWVGVGVCGRAWRARRPGVTRVARTQQQARSVTADAPL